MFVLWDFILTIASAIWTLWFERTISIIDIPNQNLMLIELNELKDIWISVLLSEQHSHWFIGLSTCEWRRWSKTKWTFLVNSCGPSFPLPVLDPGATDRTDGSLAPVTKKNFKSWELIERHILYIFLQRASSYVNWTTFYGNGSK